MSKLITRIAIGLSLLFSGMTKAQDWNLVTTLPTMEFTVIQNLNNKLYAAAGNKLYISSDGNDWQSETIHPIQITPNCITVFNNVIYVGTMENGVYYRNIASGSTWNHALLGLHISHFTVHEGRLHLCSQGSGVWRNINGQWNNMTADLPTYSYNVTKIVSLDGKLYAFAGANGTFYVYNPDNNKWIEDYYSTTYQPGLMMDDALADNGVLLAVNGHRSIRSDDHGEHWTSDSNGLINGINRILYKGVNSIYALSLDPNTNFTYFQKRSINAPVQTSWSNFNEVLEFYSYAIEEFRGKIYIASNQGIFVKSDSSLDVGVPVKSNAVVTLYPSPSSDGNLNIESNLAIESLEVYDLNGRSILHQTANSTHESLYIPAKGIYLVKVQVNGQFITKKAVIQ